MDILIQISNEHRDVEKIFKSLAETSKSDTRSRRKLFEQLQKSLLVHTEAEEEVLYASLEEYIKDKQDILEAKEEHQLARHLLSELDKLKCSDDKWSAKLIVLEENIKHHIQEEESVLFERVKNIFDGTQRERLRTEFIEKSKVLYQDLEKAS